MSAGRVEFFISCSDLTAHHSFVGVFLKDAETEKWIELGRTEVSYNSNPKFAHQFMVDFVFEEEQQLRFDIYRSINGNRDLITKNVIGVAAFKLSEVVHAKHQMLTRTLTKGRKVVKNRASKRYARINLRLEPLNTDFNDNTAYNFSAKGLPKQGAFAKCNPILEIHRLGSDGKFFKVYETTVVKKSLSPKWPEFTITTARLCNGDTQRALQLKIYHVEKANRKYIGKCQSNYDKLLNDANKSYAIKNTKNKQVGMLNLASISVLSRHRSSTPQQTVSSPQKQQYMNAQNAAMQSNAQIEEKMQHEAIRKLQEQKSKRSRSKFLNYLESSELSLMVAVDFTGSNGMPSDPQSLHHVYKAYQPSPYQDALRIICGIVAPYDSDQKFPVWGFGAKFPSQTSVAHDFSVNPDGEEVDGVSGIERAYVSAIQSNAFQLSGPCCYSPILTKAINETIVSHNQVMQNENERIQYYILLILTNGQCCEQDKQPTKNLLIYAFNNNLPLSIIFVGIGDGDFAFLNELDGDFDPIKDDQGNVAKRDIVQFVAMKDFANKPKNELSRYTLREIPIQFVSYVDNNHLKPRQNTNLQLQRNASNYYEEEEQDEHGAVMNVEQGDSMYQISQTDLDEDSEEDVDDAKQSPPSEDTSNAMTNVPLPCGWEKSFTATGKVFYINHSNKSTQWDHPLKNEMKRKPPTEQQKKQAAAYNVELMSNNFDYKPKQPQILNRPLQRTVTLTNVIPRGATFQRQVTQQYIAQQQPQIQRAQTSHPQAQVVYVQSPQAQQQVQYVQQQQQPRQRIAYDQYGRQIVLPQQQQQQPRVVYAQQQGRPPVQYGQPQQQQYAQPQQVRYVQQQVQYAQPQYGQPQQQQFRKKW
eukprot:15015_1